MRIQLRLTLAALAVTLIAAPVARATDIYVLTNSAIGYSATETGFGRIDSSTGLFTLIATLNGSVTNLAWNPAGNNFFVTEGELSQSTTFRTLETNGTLSNSLGATLTRIYGMAYRGADSTLYGYDYDSNDTGTINSSNGAWSVLNTSPGVSANSPAGGRYTILGDTLYMAVDRSGSGRFCTMGYTSTSSFQQTTTNSVYTKLVLANDGATMYGIYGNGTAGAQQLYTINPADGALTAGPTITGTGLARYFHGAAIVPVPEPSTYALAAIASGVMAAVARRRKARQG